MYKEEEKNDEIKKINGIASANKMSLSFGITNFPSPSLEINQKKIERVVPMEIKKPLLASRVTGEKGIKKKRLTNNVAKRVKNDNLLKNSTFFDSIF